CARESRIASAVLLDFW
nr:immunoglobulin heavy chain junction region [Macaca mulatta]MOV47464.1 immunoglobulin heavy chain junction region [Macaca mulatta]MOV47667.1 immunoglobulin heavy chain junction region [Macaca mulatta]